MSDPPVSSSTPPASPAPVATDDYKTKKVAEVAMTVGFFCCVVLFFSASWPVAFGVAAIAASTTVICLRLMK